MTPEDQQPGQRYPKQDTEQTTGEGVLPSPVINNSPDTPPPSTTIPTKTSRVSRKPQPSTARKMKGGTATTSNGTNHSPPWSGELLRPAPKEDLDITKGARTRNIHNRSIFREQAAEKIAIWVICAFMLALTFAFTIMIMLIIPLYWFTPETMTEKFMPTMPNVLEVVKIIGGIFSPLLAFILGYYFSVSTQNMEKSDDQK